MINVKQLSQNKVVFFPQTSAEAVLVNSNNKVITLDTFVNKKTTIFVNNEVYTTLGGYEDLLINFGDDFTIDENNNIKLTWSNT